MGYARPQRDGFPPWPTFAGVRSVLGSTPLHRARLNTDRGNFAKLTIAPRTGDSTQTRNPASLA